MRLAWAKGTARGRSMCAEAGGWDTAVDYRGGRGCRAGILALIGSREIGPLGLRLLA